jgi:hypothetical protein
VENIFLARPEDYRKADIKVKLGGADGSAVILPVVSGATAKD